MSLTIELRDVPQTKAAGVEFHSGLSHIGNDLGEAYGRIFRVAGQEGAAPTGPAVCAYPDESFDPEDFTAVAAVPFDREIDGEGVHTVELPGGRAVVATVVGPYDALAEAWQDTMRWTIEHDLTIAAMPYEVYRVDSLQAASEEALETDLVIPVA